MTSPLTKTTSHRRSRRPGERDGLTARDRPPVVIGGVGGSGTRIIAAMLIRLGYHLGDDLNRSLDNLWFTFLFRRPRWWSMGPPERSIDRNLSAFHRAMRGDFRWTPSAAAAVLGACREMESVYNREWVRSRISSMRTATPKPDAAGWGWKEPNTHVMLAELTERLPGLRYIHVVRHGLDMALSENQHQMERWGSWFEVPTHLPIQERSARYWLAANRRAVEFGGHELGTRFHLVDFDRMCLDPAVEIGALLGFLDKDPALAGDLESMVCPPKTIGRHRHHAQRFDPETVEEVETFLRQVRRL